MAVLLFDCRDAIECNEYDCNVAGFADDGGFEPSHPVHHGFASILFLEHAVMSILWRARQIWIVKDTSLGAQIEAVDGIRERVFLEEEEKAARKRSSILSFFGEGWMPFFEF
jgi:hypothetical protein